MLQLRLEAVPSTENELQVCKQATGIATILGIHVVFEHNGKDVIAKPGMDGVSLLFDLKEAAKSEAAPKPPKEPKEPKEPKAVKETEKKGGKGKDATEVTPQADVQKESI